MSPHRVPKDVYVLARSIYVGTVQEDKDGVVTQWATKRWPTGIPSKLYNVTFWIMSQAAQDGREYD